MYKEKEIKIKNKARTKNNGLNGKVKKRKQQKVRKKRRRKSKRPNCAN
jgi:hypothetical protein